MVGCSAIDCMRDPDTPGHQGDRHRHADAMADVYADLDVHALSNVYATRCVTDVHSRRYVHTPSYLHGSPDTDPHANGHADPHTSGDADPHSNCDAQAALCHSGSGVPGKARRHM